MARPVARSLARPLVARPLVARSLVARSLVAATILAATGIAASPAAADLPPPPGVRRVPFQIRVEGLAAFPDMVIVAYPYSLSNGAPTTEHALLKDGEPTGLGRRSPTPKLWAVKKSDYEAFAATYKPTRSFEDAPLDAFFKSGKALDCGVTISPVHQLPIADPRAEATQSFHADAVSATQCKLTAAPPPRPAPTDTGERAEQVAPPPDAPQEGNALHGNAPQTGPSQNDGTTAGDGAPPKTQGGGCAGCATASATVSDRWPVGAALLPAIALAWTRWRRAARSSSTTTPHSR